MMFAVSVTAGTYRGQQRPGQDQQAILGDQCRERNKLRGDLFANVEQRFEELLVNSPEDVKVQCVKSTNNCIFIPLVNL